MKKFEVKISQNRWGTQMFKIVDDNHNYLHSDGVVYPCGEYWPTKKQAQAVLDKFRCFEKFARLAFSYSMGTASFQTKIEPKPKHVWKHGDVFRTSRGFCGVYVHLGHKDSLIWAYGTDSYKTWHGATVAPLMSTATFLFNIKTVIKDKL